MSRGRELALGVIGLGFGANHARVLSEMEGVRLAAVCDSDEGRLAAATKGRALHAYTDYEAMLCEEQLDAVVVAVPARRHEDVALAAIGAGCAVLVEKPLAPSLEEGRRLVEAARRAGVPLMPGHVERFNRAIQELHRRLQAGEAGRVLQLTARRLGPFAPRTRDVGVVHDLAFHDIDAMHYLLGAEIERAHAETHTGLRTEFDDSLTALLRFGDGAIGTLEVSWLSPRKLRDLTVLCDGGLYVADYLDYRAPSLTFYAPDGEAIGVEVEPVEPLELELRAFVAALRDGAPMPVADEDGLAALAVCDALTESARTGQPVRPARWK